MSLNRDGKVDPPNQQAQFPLGAYFTPYQPQPYFFQNHLDITGHMGLMPQPYLYILSPLPSNMPQFSYAGALPQAQYPGFQTQYIAYPVAPMQINHMQSWLSVPQFSQSGFTPARQYNVAEPTFFTLPKTLDKPRTETSPALLASSAWQKKPPVQTVQSVEDVQHKQQNSRSENEQESNSENSATTKIEITLTATQKEQIKKYKISDSRIQSEVSQLVNLSYTQQQALKVIIRKYSKNTVAALIKYHSILTSEKYQFSHQDLIKIASHGGGSNNLEALQSSSEALIALGFTKEELVKIVSHIGGSNNLKALQSSYKALIALGFTKEELVNIVSHGGGSHNLEALQSSSKALIALGFTKAELVKIVSHGGGSKNLEALQSSREALIALGFTKEELVKIVSHGGGSHNLEALQSSCEALIALGFTKEELVKIVSHGGGSHNLKSLQSRCEALIKLGFTKADLVKIVSHGGGSHNLEALQSSCEALITLGFTKEELVKIVSHSGGSNNLKALQSSSEALIALGFTKENFVKIVSHHGGSNNLKALQSSSEALITLGFTKADLVKIVSHHGGSKNLKALQSRCEALITLGFTKDELVKIVSHDGGSHNLKALQSSSEALIKLGFTKADLVKIVSHHGGSKNLKALQSRCEALIKLGFTKEELVKIVSHHGGSHNLKALQSRCEALIKLGFTKADLVKIVSHGGGSHNLEALQSSNEALNKLGFTKEELVKIVSYHGGSRNLEALQSSNEALNKLGFTKEELVNIVSHHGGSRNLYFLTQHIQKIREFKLSIPIITSYFTYGCRGRVILSKLFELISQSHLTPELLSLENTQERTEILKKIKNIRSLVLSMAWIEKTECQTTSIQLKLKHIYLPNQFLNFFNNSYLKLLFKKISTDSLSTLFIELKDVYHGQLNNDMVPDVIKFLMKLKPYTYSVNHLTLFKQLKYDFSEYSLENHTAVIRLDSLSEIFQKQYPKLPVDIMKALFADFFIDMVTNEFVRINRDAEEKDEAFQLIKTADHAIQVKGYGAFSDFYFDLSLPQPEDQDASQDQTSKTKESESGKKRGLDEGPAARKRRRILDAQSNVSYQNITHSPTQPTSTADLSPTNNTTVSNQMETESNTVFDFTNDPIDTLDFENTEIDVLNFIELIDYDLLQLDADSHDQVNSTQQTTAPRHNKTSEVRASDFSLFRKEANFEYQRNEKDKLDFGF